MFFKLGCSFVLSCAFWCFWCFLCVRNLFVKKKINKEFKTALITSFILLLALLPTRCGFSNTFTGAYFRPCKIYVIKLILKQANKLLVVIRVFYILISDLITKGGLFGSLAKLIFVSYVGNI